MPPNLNKQTSKNSNGHGPSKLKPDEQLNSVQSKIIKTSGGSSNDEDNMFNER